MVTQWKQWNSQSSIWLANQMRFCNIKRKTDILWTLKYLHLSFVICRIIKHLSIQLFPLTAAQLVQCSKSELNCETISILFGYGPLFVPFALIWATLFLWVSCRVCLCGFNTFYEIGLQVVGKFVDLDWYYNFAEVKFPSALQLQNERRKHWQLYISGIYLYNTNAMYKNKSKLYWKEQRQNCVSAICSKFAHFFGLS